ncbi:MAG: alanine--tRNA ligase [Epsilonproteobacteria bacterium]|nr:alanine--tRNA ligase [Campylobacterota bacterium]
MNSFQIRNKFLEFFEKNGHTIVPSSSLIPAQDPTLLFANAGMNQFKDVFLGNEKRSYTTAATAQKCVRAGGKHNDLDNVGFTQRHLTFFEMLGNFSFDDYFKKEAIQFAWNLLTKEFNFDTEKMYATVFKEDDEAYNIWKDVIGLSESRISKLDEKDNFWQMGDTGPCGPCSEIYVDLGPERGCGNTDCKPGCDCDRFMEVWNMVFMQYNKQEDGTLAPLGMCGVDTGMGLERLCVIMQGKNSVYQTDLFQPLIKRIEKHTGKSYEAANAQLKAAFHVLADHARSSALLIADGCSPSNEGRGYVLRKIIRRAALFSQKLSADLSLFVEVAKEFIAYFTPVYPELKTNEKLIITLLSGEIERFTNNLVQGENIFATYMAENKAKDIEQITGQQAFKLYDTYGFPLEVTILLAQENGMKVNITAFEQEMKKQKEQSRVQKKTAKEDLPQVENIITEFIGYQTTECKSPVVFVDHKDDYSWIITEKTPFYVESGGQVNDTATLTVRDTTYPVLDLVKLGDLHKPAIAAKIGNAIDGTGQRSDIKKDDVAHCLVDAQIRINTVRNHTATHMLQAALLQVLGPQVKQAGSVVNDKYLRFDFTHHEPMKPEQIAAVENIVNDRIQEDIKTEVIHTTLDDAKAQGIIAFFGEKYNPESVRVVKIPGFSAELCGGTHAPSTGIIGSFKIVSDTALATGTRRLVAITGPEAVQTFQRDFNTVKKLGELFKAKPEEVLENVDRLQKQQQETLSMLRQCKKQLLKAQIPTFSKQLTTVGKVPLLTLELEDATPDELRMICQEIEKEAPGFYFILNKDSQDSSRLNFLAYTSKDVAQTVSLKSLATELKEKFNMRGGGSPTTIQGGGVDVEAGAVKAHIKNWTAGL